MADDGTSRGTFETLECWQACRALRLFVARELVPALPRDEKYRLGDQVLRAARSSTANIAEGYGRFHYLDTAKFCGNARGSVFETLDHLITAADEGLAPEGLIEHGKALVVPAGKLLNGYIQYLKAQADGVKNRPRSLREDQDAGYGP